MFDFRKSHFDWKESLEAALKVTLLWTTSQYFQELAVRYRKIVDLR